jgi:YVTN family beta-propeller protein
MKKYVGSGRSLAVLAVFALAMPVCILSKGPASITYSMRVSANGDSTELSIDDGSAECVFGPPSDLKGKPGFGWANKLTPSSYPSTLRSVNVGFDRNLIGSLVTRDSLYRIVVFRDPEMDGPAPDQQPDATFSGRVRGQDSVMTFNLATPLTISNGSFVVGVIDEFGIANLPAPFDSPGKSTIPGSEAFVTFNSGTSWQTLADTISPAASCGPGSFLIRATVESGEVSQLAVTKIKDPLAVEPWGLGLVGFGSQVLVANYISDNVTIINTADNSIQNVALVDPRQCASCGSPLGPFGLANNGQKIYVTLFGSNEIPSKVAPIDYATVLDGRVAVLTKQPDGSYTQTLLIGVGKGPRFPALVGTKLYVPCGGDDRVDVIDTLTDVKIAEIPVGADPSSCKSSLDGSKIYVTNFGDGSLSVIDTAAGLSVKNVPAPQVAIPSPAGPTVPQSSVTLSQPWTSANSPVSGYLYVTYRRTVGDVYPNGAIAVFDTCKDEFVRATLDDQTLGTSPASAALAAPVVRDAKISGEGGGGPFGIATCLSSLHPMAFTNDGTGVVGLLDSRIDQVVSTPPVPIGSGAKPRGVACAAFEVPSPGGQTPPVVHHNAYVAFGQPEDCVLVFRIPAMPENIPNIPTVDSVDIGKKLRVNGRGLLKETQIDLLGSPCLKFRKPVKLKKGATQLLQKGKLADGTTIDNENNEDAIIRLLNPDGSARVIIRTFVRPVPVP